MASLLLHSSSSSCSCSWFSSLRMKPTRLKTRKLCCVMNQENNKESSEAEKTASVDPIKLAFNKAKAYKESIKSNSGLGIEQNGADGGKKDLPVSVKIAMEKAKKYKQNKEVSVSETDQGNNYELTYLSLFNTCESV
jgi:hypothetical protein